MESKKARRGTQSRRSLWDQQLQKRRGHVVCATGEFLLFFALSSVALSSEASLDNVWSCIILLCEILKKGSGLFALQRFKKQELDFCFNVQHKKLIENFYIKVIFCILHPANHEIQFQIAVIFWRSMSFTSNVHFWVLWNSAAIFCTRILLNSKGTWYFLEHLEHFALASWFLDSKRITPVYDCLQSNDSLNPLKVIFGL